jgi:hypothetical protein
MAQKQHQYHSTCFRVLIQEENKTDYCTITLRRLVNAMCSQVEVSATSRSLVQRSSTENACVTECYRVQH